MGDFVKMGPTVTRITGKLESTVESSLNRDRQKLHCFLKKQSRERFSPNQVEMRSSTFFCLYFLLLVCVSESVKFNCSGIATCQSLAGYVPSNATTYAAILSLFQIPVLYDLLGANNLPLSTLPSTSVPSGTVVRVPFPCSCSNGIGRSRNTPIYTFKPTDVGLDDIARRTYDLFITYEDIAEANGIKDVNKIASGTKLWIPLPCSCDAVDGGEVVHLAHLVDSGSTINAIAEQFGTSPETLLRINGIGDPTKLQAGQAIDVPLKACSSSISSESLDSDLRLPNGSYAVTAHDCIRCSCSSVSGYQLVCNPGQELSKSCPVAKCDDKLSLGSSVRSGCELTTCSYAGYNASTSSPNFSILTKITTKSLCNNAPAPVPAGSGGSLPGGTSPPGGSLASDRPSRRKWMWSLIFALPLIGSGFVI
ncbi:hypothetical protein HPP92_020706 [Vanilla planifolia]|uniref:LysM domain-containing protein n=1 Tax=Vanilla planifolia TaxID=51239 RepID=A0A835PZM4_VANPL|nr:hypothetical protein HPP92_020706 [Vanilla planifolia]